jgi:transcriptional regulator GlxA family with amidase domain
MMGSKLTKSSKPRPGSQLAAEIGLLIYPDCQLAAVYGLTDLFRIAGDMSEMAGGPSAPRIRVTHWKPSPRSAECVFDSHPAAGPPKPGHLIAPPSLIMPNKMQPGGNFAGWVRKRHDEGATVCSVCAGAFLLGEAGLLEGREATTHWAFADALGQKYPNTKVDTDRMIIDDGDIITAGGILAWADLGLTLVERMLGPSVMLSTARFLLIDPPRREQRPYSHFIPRLDHGDAPILRVQHWLQSTGAKDHDVVALATRAGLEERTFLRRFRKATGQRPTEYAQNIRVSKAREALELTRRPIEQIAWEVGYGDASAFRKLFQRVTGLAPADYRRRFGVAA